MYLGVLRHGEAEKLSVLYTQDHLRPLTEEGEAATQRTAAGLSRLIGQFDAILTSPLLRARQTAQIVSLVTEYHGEPMVENVLDGRSTPPLIMRRLAALSEMEAVLVVGHSPNVNELVRTLITGDESLRIELPAGGFAFIEVPNPNQVRGFLHWLIPPEAW